MRLTNLPNYILVIALLFFGPFLDFVIDAAFTNDASPKIEQVASIPEQPFAVIDQTGTLTKAEIQHLSNQLFAFEKENGAQLSVLIVPTTGEEAIEQYSMRVVEEWKLGRKDIDDGVLLLIAKEQKELRIEVGYGLEGSLSDVVANRIINEVIVPEFQDNKFYQGIELGMAKILSVINDNSTPKLAKNDDSYEGFAPYLIKILLLVLFMSVIVRTVLKKLISNTYLPVAIGCISTYLVLFLVWDGGVFLSITSAMLCFMFSRITFRGKQEFTIKNIGLKILDSISGGRSGGGGGFGGGSSSGKW